LGRFNYHDWVFGTAAITLTEETIGPKIHHKTVIWTKKKEEPSSPTTAKNGNTD